MYHVELRQFPHNFCRFNLTEPELRETIVDAWVQGEWIELGERKWNSHQASLTVLEGPQLPMQQLSMGRGWRNATRRGRDVTEQVLQVARAVSATASGVGASGNAKQGQSDPAVSPTSGADSPLDVQLASDSLGLEVLATLRTEALPFAMVWVLARERYPERSASDCLELAERSIRSLAGAGLVEVLTASKGDAHELCSSNEQIESALLTIDSWTRDGTWLRALPQQRMSS